MASAAQRRLAALEGFRAVFNTIGSDFNAAGVALNGAAAEQTTPELTASIGAIGSVANSLNAAIPSVRLALAEAKAAVDALPPAVPPTPAPALVSRRLINVGMEVNFDDYRATGSYERFQRLRVLSLASETIVARGFNRALLGGDYSLLIDGVAVQTQTVAPGGAVSFVVDALKIAEGWRWFDLSGTPESFLPWPMFVQHGSVPVPQAQLPVVRGTYGRGPEHQWAMVPAQYKPTLRPFQQREYPPMPTAAPRTEMIEQQLIPYRYGNLYRPVLTASGLMHSFNSQSYFFDSMSARYPGLALLDGPRGQGTSGMITHIQFGRAGKVYFCDPWRVAKISSDGVVQTLVGYRHRAPPRHSPGDTPGHMSPDDVELVGDWSAIPPERRGMRECWGMAWDKRSLVIDETAPALPNNGTLEHPHVIGPRMFIADSRNDRILLATFAKDTHAPPVVTEFLTGLANPWDCVCVAGVLYVSERMAHRICAYDATTGALLRVVLQGRAFSQITPNSSLFRIADLPTIQAEPCVAPEGLYVIDDDPWLYFGSWSMAQVRRVHLQSGAVEVVMSPQMAGAVFVKIAVSDGSFYPRGQVFAATWAITSGGRPDGLRTSSEGDVSGPGTPWDEDGYSSAVGVGQNRLAWADSNEGLTIVSKALATDAQIRFDDLVRYHLGRGRWFERGYIVTHGPNGWGNFGLPIPWGEDADMNYFLMSHGHRP